MNKDEYKMAGLVGGQQVSPNYPDAAACVASEQPVSASLYRQREIERMFERQKPEERHLARNRKPSEVAVTKRTLIAAQNALGVFADGNFGVLGESKTRPAIEEFQRGRNKRSPAQWPAADVNGELSGRTGELLPFLSPMPPIFRTRSAMASVMAKSWSPWSSSIK